jgi:hypothetical protein
MATTLTFKPQFLCKETIDATDQPLAVGVGSTPSSFDVPISEQYTSSDTPYPTTFVGNEYTLTSGSPTTLDLTAIASAMNAGVNASASGLQLLGFKMVCDPANTGTVSVEQGASNPYLLFGSAGLVILQPGCVLCMGIKKKTDNTMPSWGLPDVDGTHKTVKLSTTVTGSKIKFLGAFG